MSIEQLIKKKKECMISSFLEEGVFSLLAGRPLFPFSFSFYILGNPNLFSTK
jgi:hypothetical protein